MEKLNIKQKLSGIQNEMKVPKNLFNKFGNYSYRNAETILETAKPICKKYGCTLIVQDAIENIGSRFYVKSTATLMDQDSAEYIECSAYAREEESKKGLDGSQLTGSTSSYARKYAMNGLFNLDDNKDADSDEFTEVQNKAEKKADKKPKEQLLEEAMVHDIKNMWSEDVINNTIAKYNASDIYHLPLEVANAMIAKGIKNGGKVGQ